MKTIFLKELKLGRRTLIICSALMLLAAAFGAVEFVSLQDSMDVIATTVADIPRIVRIMFGVDALPLNTDLGGYACMYYWFCLITFPFATWLGVHTITKEERFKTGEFLYTKPYTRSTVILSKMLAALVSILVLTLTACIGSVAFILPLFGGMALLPQVIITSAGMLFTQLIFLVVGMQCAALFKSNKTASRTAFIVLIFSYLVAFIIEYSETVDFLGFLSPVWYFNGPMVAQNGISLLYLLLAMAVVSMAAYFTVAFYRKRDLYT
ncbi:MAG: ABC transporter permease [Syntrophomonadaceae bacterium]|nr:ABC transporter permease [Syntrophomonadaceae bacterium]